MKTQRPMNLPSELPAGLLPLPYGKGCILLLTEWEVTAGIRRGKWWRPVEAAARGRRGESKEHHKRRGEPVLQWGTYGSRKENIRRWRAWRRGVDSNHRTEVLQTSPLASWVPRPVANHRPSCRDDYDARA